MAIMLAKTYDAFKAAGAPDDKARDAAEEIAGYENRLAGIEGRLRAIESRLSMLQWMVGVNLAVAVAIVVMLFRSLGAG